jgi:L-asparaginase II
VSDGDISLRKANGEAYSRVRPAVALEILRQLDVISSKELAALADDFGPVRPVTNWRKLVVGEIRPAFTLHKGG